MTSSPFKTRRNGTALDIAVAALAAASVAFVTFAMPEDIFSGLVTASRLPDFVAAAQPPLGQTARLAAMAAASLITFGLVYSLLRALDSLPSAGRRPAPALSEDEAPRLRRADAHPDAPSRRPLLARHELGEPEEVQEEAPREKPEEPRGEIEPQPLPAFLVPEEVPVPAAEHDPAAEPYREPEPELEPEPFELTEEAPQSLDILSARLPRAGQGEGEESVSKLMRRLEGGLSRRRQPAAVAAPSESQPEAEPEVEAPVPDRVGHRLRSAISELQRVSAPGG
jgi:hypothetical protein